jgi:cell wall-associated NlpC family hydrolase
MEKKFFNNNVSNIYTKPNVRSEVSTQILYGEEFKILNKKKNWLKIKTNFDNYIGYIKNQKFRKQFKPQLKIFKSKSTIFLKKKDKFSPSKNFLYFASGISVLNENKEYLEFEKNKWIKKKDTKNINHYEANFLKIIKLFLNSKYLWGGKTLNGIDCSALIQIYFYYNRIFFPRDSKDQIKYCKKKKNKKFNKGDIIFWKGHVGICLNKSKFIHAYGPRKKVLIMPINSTIELIKKTANLKVKKITNINKY